ncbi:hypothetical protein F0562_009729 [Nyssa sinensis]|uniref:MalT-like TPR region domain-containing protein n=1 Tax=Nyssa sinensis TaxID=561372 RepID=A0A5J4ZZR7_9ASTE|nr:hypothetical protein F0562_009729 [Nyssa sinensis]
MACVYILVQNSEEEREYFKQGKTEQFRQILEEGSSPGQLLLAKGEVEQAFAAFKIVLDGDRDNVPALLGQACVQFSRGRYSDSLELYKMALQVYPQCPGAVRLGIGLCRYKLGQYEKAKQAFQRVLELDAENVEAIVALGILDLQMDEAAGIRRGMEKMQRAFEIYPYCAMSLNYLANHFFFTGQHFLLEQLTETSLSVTNHGPTKSHSYYNLARSHHSKGDYEKAGLYYMASVKESNKPHEFVLPYYVWKQVLEVYPENCETLKALGHIYVQLGQTEKAQEFLRKVTKIDPHDAQAFLDLGELLILTDAGAALDAFKTACGLLKKQREEVPIELLNNIGVLQFEKGEFELAEQTFKEGLGDGMWHNFLKGQVQSCDIDAAYQYNHMQLFYPLEEAGKIVELPWNKISTLFNLARLLEQLHNTETASILYRLILFKLFLGHGSFLCSSFCYQEGPLVFSLHLAVSLELSAFLSNYNLYPDYVDAYLRLAAIAKAQNNVQLSIELIGDALKVDAKCPNALLMLGDVELKNDDWVKAKDTFRAAKDATDGKDSYATLCLGNWNYFAAVRSEKRAPKLEATHLEKAKELYTKVLVQHTANLYAANGAGVVLAEKGHFDVSTDLFTQVQEAAIGSVFVQMPDVWINLAHVHFAQGNFMLAVKMYQNCLRKFYYNTDSQVLLYLAQFDAGVAMQKFSASTLQKTKRTADEVRSTVAELKNAVRIFSQLSVASNLHFHGFDEKKIETHVGYCKHLLEAAKVHCEAAEREEEQNKQRQQLAHQVTLAEEARRKAEEQRKSQLERRKQEDELKKVMQQEEHLERIKEQWKSSVPASKRKDRPQIEDEEGGHGEKRRRKGGKRRKRDKSSKSHYDTEEAEADIMDDQEEMEDEDTNMNYREPSNQMNDHG